MKKLFFTLLLLIVLTNLKGQTFEIHGQLLDSLNKTVLSYGNIIIKNAKDSSISGILTDEKGKFTIKKIPSQSGLYLIATFVGFKNKVIALNPEGKNRIDVEEILMTQETYSIKETSVVGTTKYMERKFDRLVFNMNDNRVASANSVLDLLRTLPGVSVDEQGNIRYKGTQATIYVDDQPASFMFPKVEMIPVALVKKIELIDASMFNGGAGKGGIINFKMKSVTTDGLSGLASADANTIKFNKVNQFKEFTNINYKINNITLFDNFSLENQNQYSNQTTNGLLNYNGLYGIQENDNSDSYLSKYFNFGGAKVVLGKNSRLLFFGGAYNYSNKSNSNNNYLLSNYSTGDPFDLYSKNSNSNSNVNGEAGGISFLHIFPKGEKLMISLQLTHEQNPSNEKNYYNYQYLNSSSVDSISTIETVKSQKRDELGYAILFIHPINTHLQWNAGINGHALLQTNDDNTYINDTLNLPLSKNTNGNTQFHEFYWKMGLELSKWKISGGISLKYDHENATFKRYLFSNADTLLYLNKDFISLLPTLTVSYTIDSIQEMKFTYSKTSEAPMYTDMCNFIDRSDPRNWIIGNSELNPVVYHNLYLSYSYNRDNLNLSTEGFFNITNNFTNWTTYPYSNIIYITTPINIATKSTLGIDLTAWYQPVKKIDFSLSSSLSHSYLDASFINSQLPNALKINADVKRTDLKFDVKFNTNVQFCPSLNAMLFVNYISREITLEGYNYGYINSTASVTKKMFSDNLLITLGIHNIFDDLLKHGNEENYAGLIEKTLQTSTDYNRNFFISIQYKFKQGDRGTKDYIK